MLEEGARVRFTHMGAEAFELKVFAYINVTDFAAYLALAEALNFGILKIVEEAGVTLALPIAQLLKVG